MEALDSERATLLRRMRELKSTDIDTPSSKASVAGSVAASVAPTVSPTDAEAADQDCNRHTFSFQPLGAFYLQFCCKMRDILQVIKSQNAL